MAKAQYAASAGSADTAADADKLGGYDASEYMRKDEVREIKSSYETVEWDGAGTYSWTVPEGVTKINVTTVGGGGGAGYLRVYDSYTSNYLNGFPGGDGGGIKENVLFNVATGDKITVVVGKGGACPQKSVWRSDGYNIFTGPNPNQTGDGEDGGASYLMINNIKQTTSIANGGAGGSIKYKEYIVNGVVQKYTYETYRQKSLQAGGAAGGIIHLNIGPSRNIWGYNGSDSSHAQGGQIIESVARDYKFTNTNFTNLVEYGAASGGGASYGQGASCYLRSTKVYAKRGGGGAHCPDFYSKMIDGAAGYVKISYTRLYSD